ncbi:MAG: monofunctional biosynthetic peptidoglycan transglycosylase [Saprospiraceae bacterium]
MLRRIWTFILAYYTDVIVGLVCFSVFWVMLYRFVPIPGTLLMVKRMIQSESDFSLQYSWKPYHKMSFYPKVCAMASEDQMLPFHYGIDISSIVDAVESNGKKRMRGASTITQQVAKNAFLFPSRSFLRKGLELYFTILIEAMWTKERILEVYLNIAEMGDKVFGVEAAAQKYFNKPASKLGLKESALVIATLPNPIKYKASSPGSYLRKRQAQIASLFYSLDGKNYLRELYVRTDKSLYDFGKYK